MTVDISNVINVSLSQGSSLLNPKNPSNLVLFSNDSVGFADPFKLYVNPSQVAVDFGANSLTFEMANAIFSQSPNILTANGVLAVVPLHSSTSATSGYFSTPHIDANINAFKSITDGGFEVEVDGNNSITISHLNFTSINTISDIALILQNALVDVIVSVNTSSSGGNEIVFTSKKVGSASGIAFIASSSGSSYTDITGSNYLNTSSGTTVAGINSSGETIVEAITRIGSTVQYVGILTTLLMEDAVVKSLATTVNGLDVLSYVPITTIADITNIGGYMVSGTLNKSRVLFYSENLIAASLFAASYAGRGQSVNFSGSNTLLTMNLKPLTGVTADENISETVYVDAATNGVDLYVDYGVPAVVSNGANNYFDDIYSDLALKFDLQTAGFNALRATGTKITQTEAGMNTLKDAYISVLNQYITNGTIGTGLTWNGAFAFGDPSDFARSINTYGYYIYSQPIAQQNQAQRQQRIAPVVQIAIKKAGAIHSSDIIVNIQQ